MMPPGASAARPLMATVKSSGRGDPAVWLESDRRHDFRRIVARKSRAAGGMITPGNVGI
jgi:hypothetical protein